MSYLRLAPALVALATLAAIPTAHASFPAGVWGLVDQVTLMPDGNNPSTIRIDGTFIVANQKPDFAQYPGYGEPQVGYMYYTCGEKQLALCVMEWKELLAVAGTEDNCRGWGDQSFPDNGSVRPAIAKPAAPDLYPISMGVLLGFSPCDALRTWQMNGGTTGETGETGETSTSTTGESGTTSTTGESGTVTGDTTGRTSGETASTSGETASTTGESASGDTASGDPESTGKTVTGDPDTKGEGDAEATGLSGDDPTEGAGDATAGDATAGDATAGEATGEGDSGAIDDEKGCACDTTRDPGQQTLGALGTLGMLAGFGLLRRRRRAA